MLAARTLSNHVRLNSLGVLGLLNLDALRQMNTEADRIVPDADHEGCQDSFEADGKIIGFKTCLDVPG